MGNSSGANGNAAAAVAAARKLELLGKLQVDAWTVKLRSPAANDSNGPQAKLRNEYAGIY